MRKHAFQKLLDEKGIPDTKDTFINREENGETKLTQAQKNKLKQKYNIANMDYYSNEADELFGKLRDLDIILKRSI